MMLAIQTGLIGFGPVVRPPPWTMTSAGSAAPVSAHIPSTMTVNKRRGALFLTSLIHLYDFGNFRVILEDNRLGPGMSRLAHQCHVRQLQNHCRFALWE